MSTDNLRNYLKDRDNISTVTRKVTITKPKRQAIFHTDPLKVDGKLSRTKELLEGRKYWKDEGLIFEPSMYNLNVFRESYGKLEIINEFEEYQIKPEKISDFRYKTEPFKFQELGLEKCRNAPQHGRLFAFFSDPGTGKSKVAIDRVTELHCQGFIEAVIVVAPKGVHEAEWAYKEIKKHCSVPTDIQYWYGPKTDIQVTEGFAWFCINYDAVKTIVGWDAIEDFILYHGSFAVIFDESHLIKNKSAKRWIAANKLGLHDQCYAKYLLTGTPIANNLLDEYCQFYILDPDIIGMKHASTFKRKYCIMDRRYHNVVKESINIDEFKALVDPYVYRARKSDLEDIPEKIYKDWAFTMPYSIKKHYAKMVKELLFELKHNKIKIKNALAKMLKLQQISNGFIKDEYGEIIELVDVKKNPRIKALQDLIATTNSKKIIIWCRFLYDVESIMYILNENKEQAVKYIGEMHSQHKRRSIIRWNNEPYIRFFVATTAAASTGLNLQESGCDHAIYYSMNQKLIERIQSEDRIHRIGAKVDRITYTNIIAKGSRDRAIIYNLKRKKRLSDLTLGDIQEEMKGYV